MNRRYTGIIIGLFAIAALEFGLLGADAAGITGGRGGGVPPVIERGVVATPTATATIPPWTPTPIATATPYLTPFPVTPISPPQVDITGAFLQADPLTIRCDGSQDSTVTVRLVQPNGDPAPDGTSVYAEAYNGSVFPWYGTQTSDGYATFSVRFYSDIFPSGPNLIVHSGLFEAGIRIRCAPESDGGCPPSPPATSPPCGPTATPTPYPCNPSPGSGPMSPPCPTEPPCGISPPSVSPPCATPTPECPLSPPSASPPCAEQPASDFALAIDCDVSGGASGGIQDNCTANKALGSFDVDVWAIYTGDEHPSIEAFDGQVDDEDTSRLRPIPGASAGLNENPDFIAIGEPTSWQCVPTIADLGNGDTGHALSVISCYDSTLEHPIPVGRGAIRKLFRVHYDFHPDAEAGQVELSIPSGSIFDQSAELWSWCDPGFGPQMECRGATVNIVDLTPTPTRTATATPVTGNFELALDCDLAQAGIQDSCSAPLDARRLDVGVVLSNKGDVPETVAALDFEVRDDSQPLLNPPFISGGNLDRNPDFNQGALADDFFCDPVQNDRLSGDATTALSALSCIDADLASSPVIAGGAHVQVATIHYDLLAGGGPAHLSIDEGAFYNADVKSLGNCNLTGDRILLIACRGASITILPATTPTHEGTPATSTPTPTSTATPTPVVSIPGTPLAGVAFELDLDCDLAAPGVQGTCSVPLGAGDLDVGVVLSNLGSTNERLAAFNFYVRDAGESFLVPAAGGGPLLDRNPDFDQDSVTGDWSCSSASDRIPDDQNVALSELACVSSIGLLADAPLVVSRSQIRVAVIHYDLTSTGGPAQLSLELTNFYNQDVTEIGSCNPGVTEPFVACRSAYVTVLGQEPTAPAGPAATSTAVSSATPVRTKTAVSTSTPVRTKTVAATVTVGRTKTVAPRTATVVAEPTKKAKRRCADVNGDGRVSLRDVRLISEQIARGVYDERFDVNGDGRVGNADAVRAIRQLGRRC